MPLIKKKMRPADESQSPKEEMSLPLAYSIKKNKRKNYAQGGEVEPRSANLDFSEDDVEPMRPSSMAEAIRMKRKAKDEEQMYADGGFVDIQDNGDEDPNEFNELNFDAAKKELYDDSQLSDQPEDSNEHGDDIDSDKHDMISQIRRKLKSKRM